MAKRKRRQHLPAGTFSAHIESLSQDGRGVAHIDDKAIFISGALPNEQVEFRYTAKFSKYDEGCVTEVVQAADERIVPHCSHAELCGGCSLQHLDTSRQIAYKQQALLDTLKQIAKIEPETVYPPLQAEPWGYRRKARLGVRYVRKKGRVLVGFREKSGAFLADLQSCKVLHPSVGEKLTELQDMMLGLEARERIPQIEVAVGDCATALVFRHLDPLSDADQTILIEFAKAHGFQLYLQPKGPTTIHRIWPEQAELYYTHQLALPDDTLKPLKITIGPSDFFQINHAINQKMVPWAMDLLDPQPDEKILDLFCGLGNFTLPLATRAREVVGVELDTQMVQRARKTARDNGIENTRYYSCNLMEEMQDEAWLKEDYDRILLDPPRLGAREVISHFGKLNAKRIVYVSCHPATLARDAAILVHELGYRLVGTGVMDMFPHTGHVESIALFER